LEHAAASADPIIALPARLHIGGAGQDDETGLAVRIAAVMGLAGREPDHLEADMGPARRLRRDLEDAAGFVRRMGADPERHAASLRPAAAASVLRVRM